MAAELICSATDPAWLERRREGITATDIVTIAGLVTWDSPWALYHRKLGLLPEPEQSDRMRLGSWLEAHLVNEWADRTEQRGFIGDASSLFRSVARPWQLATPDRAIDISRDGKGWLKGGLPAVLECKTWDERQGKAEWGPDGSDLVPRKVRAQVLWQMDTLGVGTGHVAVVFLPSGEFRSYTISHPIGGGHSRADCVICDEQLDLRDLGFGFWSRILTRRPPDLDGLEVTTDALRYLHPVPGGQIEIREGYALMWDGYAEALANAKRNHDEMKNQIRALMGDAHEATVDGRVVFRRTIGKRAGYTVPPGETDTLRRIGKDKQDGD